VARKKVMAEWIPPRSTRPCDWSEKPTACHPWARPPRSGCRGGEHANFDIDSRGQAQALVERLNRFAGWLEDVDQPLVRPDFKLLAGFPVDVRAAQHGVALDARRQGDRAMHRGPGALGRVHDFVGGAVEHLVVKSFHADTDTLVCETCQGP